ncbi:MAG: amino acid permease [Candidatus Aminicenantes bacterium]|nr:MAG: amino acid permease [Candidatus Aminicenantes bacterium]
MMMMGIVIGSGIFLTTGIMAQAVPSTLLILLAWFLGGLLILAGALTYAELGVSLPEAGGQYVYLREAYGHLFGFLFGWKMFLVNMTGSIAALGVAFAEYFGSFFPSLSTREIIFSFPIGGFDYTLSRGQLVAVAVILLLTAINYVGVSFGKTVQNVLTVIKIGTILVFVILGFVFANGISIDLTFNPEGWSFAQLLTGFGLAFVSVFWAFDGWNNINYVAGEIKDPKRNLKFALIMGTLGITLLYFFTNVIYFLALPVGEMKGVVTVAERASVSLFGATAAGLISAMILISILGALNGAIFVGPRVYYAMARDGLFFKKVGGVHPRFKTPGFSLVLQAIWASLLALTGTFEQLFTFAMFAGILFWVLAAAAIYTLRKKRPDLPRPYKAWGYPIVPMIFILALSGILLNTVIRRPVESLAGIALMLAGIPVYFLWDKNKSS